MQLPSICCTPDPSLWLLPQLRPGPVRTASWGLWGIDWTTNNRAHCPKPVIHFCTYVKQYLTHLKVVSSYILLAHQGVVTPICTVLTWSRNFDRHFYCLTAWSHCKMALERLTILEISWWLLTTRTFCPLTNKIPSLSC